MPGWSDLGEMLGGAGHATYEKAYNEGRFRSAQTEDALTQARINQAKAVDQELTTKQKTELLARPGALKNPDEQTLAQLLVGGLGSDYQAASTGMSTQQNMRFKDQVANVGTNNEQRLRDLQAIEGKPSADVEAVGANDYVNLADDLQVPTITDSAKYKVDNGGEGLTPAIKNFRFGEALPPDDRSRFTPYVRNDVVVQAGGVPTNTGFGGKGAPTAVVDPTTVAQNKGLQSQATAEGTARGTAVATAPHSIQQADNMLADVDGILKDTGFDSVYGKSGAAWERAAPELQPREYRSARAKLDQLRGEAFSVAIKDLKGTGPVSNAEGAKVQEAYALALQSHQDEEDARAAWLNFKVRLKEFKRKAAAEQQAGILAPVGGAAPADNSDISTMSDEELQRIVSGG